MKTTALKSQMYLVIGGTTCWIS